PGRRPCAHGPGRAAGRVRRGRRTYPHFCEESVTMSKSLFGNKACDTMKKARTWLDEHGVDYQFHDYKAVGIDRGNLEKWCNEHGWETVLNRAGTTFRKLEDSQKADLD